MNQKWFTPGAKKFPLPPFFKGGFWGPGAPSSAQAWPLPCFWGAFTCYWYLVAGGPIFAYKAGRAAWNLLSKPASENRP